ncbi:Protein of unknown function [Gryllus bimaculatus]|nr:Protein of unknown function [Gryllus bimaculatus]
MRGNGYRRRRCAWVADRPWYEKAPLYYSYERMILELPAMTVSWTSVCPWRFESCIKSVAFRCASRSERFVALQLIG